MTVEQVMLSKLAGMISTNTRTITAFCEEIEPRNAACSDAIAGLLDRIVVQIREHQRRGEPLLAYLRDLRDREPIEPNFTRRFRRLLALDHTEMKARLDELRELTGGYQSGASPQLLASLRKLDRLMAKHVNLTYELLFPRLVEMENARGQDAAIECEPW
jgi:iron-sulfur cluster repair protein YtfE (RIC family)